MHKLLEAAGMGFEDVAKVICYMEKHLRTAPKINVARKDFFGDSRPTSTLFGIRRLAIPGMGPRDRSDRLQGQRQRAEAGARFGSRVTASRSATTPTASSAATSTSSPAAARSMTTLKLVGGDDMTAQAVQTHDNIERILAAGGMSYEDVAKVTVYMDNTEERKVLDEVRKRYFGNTRPASTLFGANRLALFGMKLEIETIAYKPDSGD